MQKTVVYRLYEDMVIPYYVISQYSFWSIFCTFEMGVQDYHVSNLSSSQSSNEHIKNPIFSNEKDCHYILMFDIEFE